MCFDLCIDSVIFVSVLFVCSVEKSFSGRSCNCWHRFSGVCSKLVVRIVGNAFGRVSVNFVISV